MSRHGKHPDIRVNGRLNVRDLDPQTRARVRKKGAPSSREASANYGGPCGQKFQVTYLRSCARFHGLGAVRARKRNTLGIRAVDRPEGEGEREGQREKEIEERCLCAIS